jgi:PAS domain S-box-containing protein
MLGLREKDLIGARLLDIVAPDHRSLCLRYYEEKLADDGKKGNIEIDIICNSGDLLSVEVAIGITMYESKPATVAYILDITERKYAEKRARELEALKEIDSLRGELVANVSHELRTPLTAIKGFVSTLLRTDVQWSDEEKEDFLKTIAEETNRLASLIDDTLDISRIETGTLRLKRGYYTAADVFQSIHTNLASLTSCHLLEISLADGLLFLY